MAGHLKEDLLTTHNPVVTSLSANHKKDELTAWGTSRTGSTNKIAQKHERRIHGHIADIDSVFPRCTSRQHSPQPCFTR